MERNEPTLVQDLERDDIERHLLEQLLKPILYMLKKNNLLLNCGKR